MRKRGPIGVTVAVLAVVSTACSQLGLTKPPARIQPREARAVVAEWIAGLDRAMANLDGEELRRYETGSAAEVDVRRFRASDVVGVAVPRFPEPIGVEAFVPGDGERDTFLGRVRWHNDKPVARLALFVRDPHDGRWRASINMFENVPPIPANHAVAVEPSGFARRLKDEDVAQLSSDPRRLPHEIVAFINRYDEDGEPTSDLFPKGTSARTTFDDMRRKLAAAAERGTDLRVTYGTDGRLIAGYRTADTGALVLFSFTQHQESTALPPHNAVSIGENTEVPAGNYRQIVTDHTFFVAAHIPPRRAAPAAQIVALQTALLHLQAIPL